MVLDDSDGTLLAEIKKSCSEEPEEIKQSIIKQSIVNIWIDGYGKEPISWEAMASIVKSMGAADLEEDICQGSSPQGERT